MHPVASSCFLLFLFFRFSGYLKCPKNSGKIILKIGMTEPSGVIKEGRGATTRQPGGLVARPHPGLRGHPLGCPVGPLDAPFTYIYPSGWKPLIRIPFSRTPLCSDAAAILRSGLPGEAAPAPYRKEEPPPGDPPSPWTPPGCAVSSLPCTMGP